VHSAGDAPSRRSALAVLTGRRREHHRRDAPLPAADAVSSPSARARWCPPDLQVPSPRWSRRRAARERDPRARRHTDPSSSAGPRPPRRCFIRDQHTSAFRRPEVERPQAGGEVVHLVAGVARRARNGLSSRSAQYRLLDVQVLFAVLRVAAGRSRTRSRLSSPSVFLPRGHPGVRRAGRPPIFRELCDPPVNGCRRSG